MRALLYGRVSHDPSGRGRTVDSQLSECRRWADREGWDVVGEVRDVDRSASRHARRRREGWDDVIERLEAGDADVLVTWEASRAHRDLEQYAELRRVCERTRTRWAYSGTVYDLGERSDRFRTGLDALVAEDEAGRVSERVLRGVAEAAVAGRPTGRLLYGYRRIYDDRSGELVRQEPDGVASEVVAEVARRFLAGESLRSLTTELNARGVPGPAKARDGGPSIWHHAQLHRLLKNPAYAGQRVHRGEVVGPAAWPAIIAPEDWRRVQARLADPARRAARRTQQGPVNLLTGIARCGVCGAGLKYGRDSRGDRALYSCRAGSTADGPGFHIGRDMRQLDAYVTTVVLDRLARGDVDLGDDRSDDALEAGSEVDELRERLNAVAAEYVAGKLTATMLARVERELLDAIAAAERRARYVGLPTTVAELVDGDRTWDELTVEQRREVIRSLVTIRVNRLALPAGRRGFDPSAIELEFRR